MSVFSFSVVFHNGVFSFDKIFKVKLVGKIALDVKSSDIHIGDRIVLINPFIAPNTDFLQRSEINDLSAVLSDDTNSKVLFCAKVPVCNY